MGAGDAAGVVVATGAAPVAEVAANVPAIEKVWLNVAPGLAYVVIRGSRGATFSQTFSTAGTFAYLCSIHPSMTGTIAVH